MAAAPLDLISDMAAIAEHHEEGIRLHRAGVFTEAEWAEHQRISYGVDGAGDGRDETAEPDVPVGGCC